MSVTRRTMLVAGPAVAAAAMTNPVLAQGQPAPGQSEAPVAGQQAPGFYRYKIGDIEATAINDGRRPSRTPSCPPMSSPFPSPPRS